MNKVTQKFIYYELCKTIVYTAELKINHCPIRNKYKTCPVNLIVCWDGWRLGYHMAVTDKHSKSDK